MKKYLLSAFALASIVFSTNAVTFMQVKTDDGKIVKYNIDRVSKVYYVDSDSAVYGVSINGKIGNYTYVDLGLPSGIKWDL